MSSTFSMANQKLKQFFGASQTKDFNLQSQKDIHYSGSAKLNNFLEALKQYSTLFQSLPRTLEKLYKSFGQLSPRQIYYDSAEYRNHFQKIVEDAKVKANSVYDRYFFFAKQVGIEQQQIKKVQKEFEVTRQRYDHYKSKVQKLTKQFATIQNNPKVYKEAKEQVDRNIGKLTNSEAEYNKQVVKMRAKLQNYYVNFSDMAFSCFELFSDDLVSFVISSAKEAESIKEFLANKRSQNGRKTIVNNNRVAIETLFTKHRIDFFPELENKFQTQPKMRESNSKHQPQQQQPLSKGNSNAKSINSDEQKKSIKAAFDEFNFFREDKKEVIPPVELFKEQAKRDSKNADLLGIL